jgi:hypothetical protein
MTKPQTLRERRIRRYMILATNCDQFEDIVNVRYASCTSKPQ